MKPLQFNPDSAPFSRYLRSAGQVLWSIGIVLCVLLMGAEAALAVDLRWDPGFETWPGGNPGPITFTNVQGSGVDVRVSHTFQAGNFQTFGAVATPVSSNFVVPSGASPDTQNSLTVGINGPGIVTTDIEFFVTGTTNRVQILNPVLYLHDVDINTSPPPNPPPPAWQDVVDLAGYVGGRVGPGLGGTPVTGINVTTSNFNQLATGVNLSDPTAPAPPPHYPSPRWCGEYRGG
jgi:hypothetical protein